MFIYVPLVIRHGRQMINNNSKKNLIKNKYIIDTFIFYYTKPKHK